MPSKSPNAISLILFLLSRWYPVILPFILYLLRPLLFGVNTVLLLLRLLWHCSLLQYLFLGIPSRWTGRSWSQDSSKVGGMPLLCHPGSPFLRALLWRLVLTRYWSGWTQGMCAVMFGGSIKCIKP